MKQRFLAGMTLAAVTLLFSSIPARAQDYSAKLSGFEELGALNAETGAVLSTGQGTLKLSIDKTTQTLTYSLTYSGLTNVVVQAHIHFGKEHVPGGVMVFFCTNLGNGPAGTPACPDDTAGAVTVTGSVTASGVVGPAAQNITVGDFAGVVAALASDTVYANIHTTKYPAGEIRGQVHLVRPGDDQGENQGDNH